MPNQVAPLNGCRRDGGSLAADVSGESPTVVAGPSAHLSKARHEVLCLLPDTAELERLRHVARRARAVVPSESNVGGKVRDFVDSGGVVRVGDEMRTPLFVVDRKFALISESKVGGVWGDYRVVSAPATVHEFMATFHAHWSRADDPVTCLFRGLGGDVMRLLAVGMTDAAVARKLRICQRTVQRYVHQTMSLLGARSRIELGVELAKKGLLTDPNTEARQVP